MSAVDKIEQIERRKRARIQVHWSLFFFQTGTAGTVETTTCDLSSDGFYCRAGARFIPGEIRECTLGVPTHLPDAMGREIAVHCRVRVVRVEELSESGLYGVGFRIEDYKLIPSEARRNCFAA
jgi:hypothetical protein